MAENRCSSDDGEDNDEKMKVTTTEYSFLKLGGHGYQD